MRETISVWLCLDVNKNVCLRTFERVYLSTLRATIILDILGTIFPSNTSAWERKLLQVVTNAVAVVLSQAHGDLPPTAYLIDVILPF